MFQFPANPVLDQQFSPAGGPTYTWNGTGWAPFTRVYNGGLTFTGPVLFPDGTTAAPGIAWANETDSGFIRPSANVMQAVIDGAPIWGINKTQFNLGAGIALNGGTATFGSLSINNTGSVWGNNTSGTAGDMLHAGGDNRIWIGRTVWGEVMLCSAGTTRIQVHAGGTAFTGTVTGITATMVGLGNVTNEKQVVALTGSGLGLYYDGQIHLSAGGSWFGNIWPMNVSGTAARLFRGGNTADAAMVFNWSGQGGQPSWLWGGSDGTNMYVYNPSNFSVNYAGTAGNANAVNNVSGWNYSNRAKNPAYLWCTDGSGSDQFLTGPGNINVNYANSCDYSNRTGTVNGASGGTVNSKIQVNASFPTSTNDAGNSNFFAEGYAPAIGWHYPGQQTYKTCLVDSVALRTGSGSNNGPGGIGGAAFQINNDGNCFCRNWYTTSLVVRDARSLERPLESLLRLRGVRGTDAETDSPAIGVDIDDIEREFPEMVRTASRPHDTVHGKAINYAALAAPIIEALRELNERLTALENA